jgi:Fe-S-cluster-containing hydrogenase component 2
MHAVRNIRLCTKDCLCLYVCPTGATNTETGQIDADKCIEGCRACVDACPSHAISLVPDKFPAPQPKSREVIEALRTLAERKVVQEHGLTALAQSADDETLKKLSAGFMIAQSDAVRQLLKTLLDAPQPDDFPRETVEALLAVL